VKTNPKTPAKRAARARTGANPTAYASPSGESRRCAWSAGERRGIPTWGNGRTGMVRLQ
jgi:hypothetical protein